jgi:CBS domain-containing protein
MAQLAREVMTSQPACCAPDTPLDEVARMMVHNDCGEIPVIDPSGELIGVVTDRDIVCRIVADGRNPVGYPAEHCMSQPVVSVRDTDTLDEVLRTMEKHQIRRVPVIDERGRCVGIISQADLAWSGSKADVAELVREVSRDTGRESRA